ncbi:hypothetical protein ACIQC9_14495 [Brevundimonas sp. NPDC092305]|uniref:hypothetical protein n=1 Tax=Brevundimonas sp. NPDC092305 TaxID=3363957 RepID=UPI0037FE7754
MRPTILLSALVLALPVPALAQTASPPPAATPAAAPAAPVADPADVASVDAIVAAMYDVISGKAGAPRNWDRFHSLFLPGAIMTAAGRAPDGTPRARAMSPTDYIARNGPVFAQEDFYEREIGRQELRFGRMITVRSAYDIRRAPDATEVVQRGVNTLQLFDDGTRLWVVSIAWAGETPDNPIPADLLPAS